YVTLLAAFQALLQRYTGQEKIIVGSPVANRSLVELEGLIGFFVNNLVICGDASGAPTFLEFAARLRETVLSAYSHQQVPFEKLVEELQVARDLSRNPLFQVFFNMLNFPYESIELHGIKLTPLAIPDSTTHFDITLYAQERSELIEFSIVYSTDL